MGQNKHEPSVFCLNNMSWKQHEINVSENKDDLGTGQVNKSDEFSEKFQTAFDNFWATFGNFWQLFATFGSFWHSTIFNNLNI